MSGAADILPGVMGTLDSWKYILNNKRVSQQLLCQKHVW